MARDEKYINLLADELLNDENKEILDKVLSQEALNLLRVQEDEKDNDYSKFKTWKDKDDKKTPTVSYGITKEGIETAGRYNEYLTLGYSNLCVNKKPFYLEEKNVDKTWKFLNDDSQPVALRNELARRIAQYHAVINSAILDGYTNNKFSNDYNDVERQLTLLNYHTLNMAAKVDFENSMSVQAIRLNNHAMLAQSFIQKATGETKDYIKQGKIDENANRRNMYNSRFFFSKELPNPEDYINYLKPINKNNVKDKIRKTYMTLDNLSTHWFANNDYELEKPKTDLTGYQVHSSRIRAPKWNMPHTTPIDEFSSKNSKLAEASNQYRESKEKQKQINENIKNPVLNIGEVLSNLFSDLSTRTKNFFTNNKKSDNINQQEKTND